MGALLVRLAGPSCFRRDDGSPRSADDEGDVKQALLAFALRSDRDDRSRIEAGLSAYAVDGDDDGSDLVMERAAHANLDRELRKVGHGDYLLLTEEIVRRAGLVVEVVEDREAATVRLREQHREIRLSAGISNADVSRPELDQALRRLVVEILRQPDLLSCVKRVPKEKIREQITALKSA